MKIYRCLQCGYETGLYEFMKDHLIYGHRVLNYGHSDLTTLFEIVNVEDPKGVR